MEIVAVFGCFIIVLLLILFVVSFVSAITRRSKRWIAATVAVGVLGLIAILVYANRQGAAILEELNQPRVFVSSDGRVEVTAPGNWREQDFENDAANLQLGNLFREQYLLIISEEKRGFVPEFGIQDYAEHISEQMREVVDNAFESELVARETGGFPSFQRELEGEIDGLGIAYLNTFVEGDEAFHQILIWTLQGKKEQHFPLFREVTDSFRELASEAD